VEYNSTHFGFDKLIQMLCQNILKDDTTKETVSWYEDNTKLYKTRDEFIECAHLAQNPV
jgi:hypothetical protein